MRRQHGEDGIVTHRGNTKLAKKVCPRLHDLATAPPGRITQPRTNFLAQLCSVTENFGYSDIGYSDNCMKWHFFPPKKDLLILKISRLLSTQHRHLTGWITLYCRKYNIQGTNMCCTQWRRFLIQSVRENSRFSPLRTPDFRAGTSNFYS